ncbi:SRPBCC family protein [Williamsia sp. CHRR-6]|uniref:SRPBCC family protein n=1 Tax=Williamsia sp. CHRR-6 TaxID=2835871 RepID=UPI001BDA71E5|nr:SRPBCC family protein [Williamsia sp. CHRR-6]MBT0566981.1 SRPBCC family protein [Williamsia sp. CHRR-6]
MPVKATTEFDVDAPPSVIMEILLDVDALPEWSGPHKSASVLESHPDGKPFKVALEVNMAGINDREVLEYQWTDTGCSWNLLESSQLNSQVGSYTISETSKGSRVVFELEADLKIKLPGLIVKQAQKIAVDTAKKGLIAEAKRRVS